MIDRCYIEITNICNLNCSFCPKHNRKSRQLTVEEFDLLTDRVRNRVIFLYFHLMGEPMLHPSLPLFINMAREKGFKTVLTSNGTLLDRTQELLDALPHKIQLSLHSHESNDRISHSFASIEEYIDKVMQFATVAAERGTCMVLRLWNQGGLDAENETMIRLLEQYAPRPWVERPDGFRLAPNLYLEFDRKFQWPEASGYGSRAEGYASNTDSNEGSKPEVHCKALLKQIGVLADGSLVPCCLDHNGDVTLGNLLHQSLDEILQSPRAQALIEGFRHHTATEALCRNCESALIRNSFRGKARS